VDGTYIYLLSGVIAGFKNDAAFGPGDKRVTGVRTAAVAVSIGEIMTELLAIEDVTAHR
jgi:hypothetical protein